MFKSIPRAFILVLALLLGSCRATREVSSTTVTSRDSTTTISHLDIAVHIAGDSLVDSVRFTTFAEQFQKAQVGTVIRHATTSGKTLGYSIRKTSPEDFTVEAQVAPRDTTVTVSDTLTRVRITQATTKVLEIQPSAWGRIWQTAKDNLLWVLLVLVALAALRKWAVSAVS